jgi:GDP-L-fucose synthase
MRHTGGDSTMPARIFDLAGKRIYVAGHRGMVGSAIVRRLAPVAGEVITAGRDEVDLERQDQTERFLATTKPDVVVVAAATVGGIHANNTYPADFISDNLAIARNTIHASYKAGVKKLLFLGSSCIYPKLAHQPMREEDLLTGPLEPTNQWYAVAKIAGFHIGHADQSLWARRQLSPREQPCGGGADPALPRGETG